MKNFISHVLVVLLLAVSISAQDNQPVLIDEFGKMPHCETVARVQSLGIEIGNIPKSKALIRISGGQDVGFTYSYVRGSVLKAIWAKNLQLPPEKLSIQFCDVNEKHIYTKFYIVRESDQIENCEENFITPNVTTLYETVGFFSPEFKLARQEDRTVELGFAEGEYSVFAFDALRKSLNSSPESKIYVMSYLRTNFETDENGKIIVGKRSKLDKKSYADQMLRAAQKELLKNGFSPSQIVTIDGGYINDQYRKLEFWFVPQGGEKPKPKPDYVPKRKQNKPKTRNR